MSNSLKLCEHESVEWIIRKIPKFTKLSLLKKLNATVTSFDVNLDIFVLGTNNGTLFILNRHNNSMENFTIKKNNKICHIKLIHTVDLSIAIGFADGSLHLLNIPFKENLKYTEMTQFIVPTGHRTAISTAAWSKNAEKLFSGDLDGLIWCTEIDYMNKTVSTYEVCKTQTRVSQLSYDHKCLIITNETESFLWDFHVNRRIQIGTQLRNERGRFGISFVSKLCKAEELEIVVVRPDCKIWISNSKGLIKRSILLKSHMIFASEKQISLLPCFTSQSKNQLMDDVKSSKTKLNLGLSIPLSEDETLFWSQDVIVIIDITTGNIISSSCNLGKIEAVSICVIDKLLKRISNLSSGSVCEEQKSTVLYEIWILRQPLCENDNKLVRLSHIPLVTSKLLIDPYYFFSQAKISHCNENLPLLSKFPVEPNSDIVESVDDSVKNSRETPKISNSNKVSQDLSATKDVSEGNIQNSHFENWLNKIADKTHHIDVVETLNDVRSNMLELTKITKEVFESTGEKGVEQAIEMTEDGLMINFEKFISSADPITEHKEHQIDCMVNSLNKITTQRRRRENRNIQMIDLEESGDILDTLKNRQESDVLFQNPTKEVESQENVFSFHSTSYDSNFHALLPNTTKEVELQEKTFSFPSTSYDSNFHTIGSYETSGSFEIESVGRSVSPVIVTDLYSHGNQITEEDEISNVDFGEDKSLDISDDHVESEIQIDSNEISHIDNLQDFSPDIGIDISSEILIPIPIESPILYESLRSAVVNNELISPCQELLDDRPCHDDNIINIDTPQMDIKHHYNSDIHISQTLVYKDNIPYVPVEGISCENDDIHLPENLNEKNDMKSSEEIYLQDQGLLTNAIFLKCNKWISHRGPNLSSGVKLSSMMVNRRMIWLSDSKGYLYVGFRRVDADPDSNKMSSSLSSTNKMLWLCDSELRTDKISSSPGGFILWRERAGDISIYIGITKIWSPKVVQEKVLLKTNWEIMMQGIKDIDIDDDMAVIVTKKGQLKVMNSISGRTPYTQSTSVDLTGHVTLATIFNGIIWCVTEIDVSGANLLTRSQHIFACVAKDENDEFNIAYWRTVPLARDLVKLDEQSFGGLGGSDLIKSIKLGTNKLAWILTLNNMCFFSQEVSSDNPVGDGIWYQITLQFLSQTPWYSEENIPTFHNRVEKMLGYPEVDVKNKRNSQSVTSSILFSVKCAPKKARGNGLLWITSIERNTPCILFESDKNILGHHWVDCFADYGTSKNRLMGLPALTSWSFVEVASRNTLWLLHKSGELFCYWNESKIRNVAIPSSFGRIIKISARSTTMAVLTSHSKIFIRTGIIDSNPFGADWKEIKNGWRKKELIKTISCSDNEIWAISDANVYYNGDVQSLLFDSSKKSQWNVLDFKLNDSSSKRVSAVQNSKSGDMNCTWAISDPDGYIYMSIWKSFTDNFTWTYILGPRAKSIHISMETLWMVEQLTGNIYVRCGLDLENQPMGDYWVPVPLITSPVVDLAVSSSNQVFLIDCYERLMSHRWSIIEGNIESELDSQILEANRTDDQDWELLN